MFAEKKIAVYKINKYNLIVSQWGGFYLSSFELDPDLNFNQFRQGRLALYHPQRYSQVPVQ